MVRMWVVPRRRDRHSGAIWATPRVPTRPPFHPHLGTTLWTVASSPVDGSPRFRGQPVSSRGTAVVDRRPSTAATIHPRRCPRRSPHAATPSDLRRRPPSTPCTGAGTTAGDLFHSETEKKPRWGRRVRAAVSACVSGRPRSDYPLLAEVTPEPGSLYGGAPVSPRPSAATAGRSRGTPGAAVLRPTMSRNRRRERCSPP
jgi:hypothetical protein